MQDSNKDYEDIESLSEEEEELNQEPIDVPENQREIFIDKERKTIFELKRRKDRGEIDLQPPYQRKNVWPISKKSKLIESVLASIPIPAIYLAETKEETREVIDGQQRLLAFFDFLDNKYELSKLSVLEDFNGKKFGDLPPQYQRNIEDYPLYVFTIKKESHPDIKFDVFLRINQGASQLNAQEIRRCAYRGERIKLLEKLAGNDKFRNVIKDKEVEVKRLKDEELVLRFLSFYLKNYRDYTGNLNSFLNDTLENWSNYKNKLQGIEGIFSRTMDTIFKIFGSDAFIIKSKRRKKLNNSLFDILSVSFAKYDSSLILQNKELLLKQFHNLLDDKDFYDSITSSTITKDNVKLRFDKWFNVMDECIGRNSDD